MKQSINFLFVIFLVVVSFLGGTFLSGILKPNVTKSNNNQNFAIEGNLNVEKENVDINLLWEVWDLLEKEYISDDINNQELLYGAVRGLVSGLDDRYTAFLNPEETKEYLDASKSEFEGIGTTLRQEGEFTLVESPIDGSPAEKAGLLPGDMILEVEGEDMQGKSVFEVASNIRGEAGTVVTIALFRPSNSEKFDVSITRERIDIDNISYEDLGDGYFKIKVIKFTEETVQAFNNLWDDIVNKVLANNPKGLVIDLRNNPGGFVNSVEYVLGDFLDSKSLIFIEEDKNGNKSNHYVNRNGRLQDIPIVVLVNQGSASASEIFAGAIQDNNRGTIIGDKTVGKGLEQRLIPLSDGSTLQVVFQKWLTPLGKHINQEDPILPDIISTDEEEQDNIAILELKKL